jgi:hypothetical protein
LLLHTLLPDTDAMPPFDDIREILRELKQPKRRTRQQKNIDPEVLKMVNWTLTHIAEGTLISLLQAAENERSTAAAASHSAEEEEEEQETETSLSPPMRNKARTLATSPKKKKSKKKN